MGRDFSRYKIYFCHFILLEYSFYVFNLALKKQPKKTNTHRHTHPCTHTRPQTPSNYTHTLTVTPSQVKQNKYVVLLHYVYTAIYRRLQLLPCADLKKTAKIKTATHLCLTYSFRYLTDDGNNLSCSMPRLLSSGSGSKAATAVLLVAFQPAERRSRAVCRDLCLLLVPLGGASGR